MSRPNCLQPSACSAKTPDKHCRRCTAKLLATPERRAEQSRIALLRYADPIERAKTGLAVSRALAADPAKKARHAAAAAENSPKALNAGKMLAGRLAWLGTLSPEQKRRLFARPSPCSDLVGEDLALHRLLVRKGYRSAEARAIVDEEASRRRQKIVAAMTPKAPAAGREAY